ncbi:hypothetical protein VCRA2119O48_20149 [Vibrio crassostreae]|nr:hypothetical protein BCT89_02955 [Vibrio lentus]CAK2466648.1 hypothetical protein VCRA2119O48_20149 [Vibrio crassostreae]CAK2566527.1 hypothetical protein VCRA2122O10_100038 [Vibrio crassostreae]CAK3344064.1 hypothetical protein VCRA2122O339_200044 [Vibrio crassostreae]
MLVQSAIHFALDYLIQTAYRYFGLSISSNKVWGTNVLENATGKNSTYEGSGQFRFRKNSNLAKHELLKG